MRAYTTCSGFDDQRAHTAAAGANQLRNVKQNVRMRRHSRDTAGYKASRAAILMHSSAWGGATATVTGVAQDDADWSLLPSDPHPQLGPQDHNLLRRPSLDHHFQISTSLLHAVTL